MASQGCAISSVRFAPASDADQRAGLLGFVTCTMGNLVLDGITVRRTRAGQLALSFPERRDGTRAVPIREWGDFL